MRGAITTVFGLDVCADRALPFLRSTEADPSDRKLELSLCSEGEDVGWSDRAELISDQRRPDGAINFTIEEHPKLGYRIWGPRYGACLLDSAGDRLLGSPGSGGISAWQRLLIAQALPFAAVLHGLEVLHASAVARNGEAVAFLGRSGSGKTSLALSLCRRGAEFLTDDVLALERVDGELIGHPGAPVAAIETAEADRLGQIGRCLRRRGASSQLQRASCRNCADRGTICAVGPLLPRSPPRRPPGSAL